MEQERKGSPIMLGSSLRQTSIVLSSALLSSSSAAKYAGNWSEYLQLPLFHCRVVAGAVDFYQIKYIKWMFTKTSFSDFKWIFTKIIRELIKNKKLATILLRFPFERIIGEMYANLFRRCWWIGKIKNTIFKFLNLQDGNPSVS